MNTLAGNRRMSEEVADEVARELGGEESVNSR